MAEKEKEAPRRRRGAQQQPKGAPGQQRGRVTHEFQCVTCQGILANYGKGEVKCYGMKGKPYLARYEKIPTTNKKAPFVILGKSTYAETTGTKKFSTQWGAPDGSLTFSFPLLFYRSWFKTLEQFSNFETQKSFGTKVYKRFIQNGSFVYQQFLPKCSYLCNTMYSATVKLTKKISGGSSKEGRSPE